VSFVTQASYALGYNLAIEYLADYEKTWMLDSFRDLNQRVLKKDIDWIFLEVGLAQRAAGSKLKSYLVAEYFFHAWDHHNACKHNGAVLPPPSAPVGRGADGDVAMA
jgi:hypothetical protein